MFILLLIFINLIWNNKGVSVNHFIHFDVEEHHLVNEFLTFSFKFLLHILVMINNSKHIGLCVFTHMYIDF